ncbi:MAG: protein kinase [Polyangiaceae bacterium]|nr:protein kinase [Polyangiaceae bacterium]
MLEGTVLSDRYAVQTLLGRGGAGAVYRALDVSSQKTVALKLVERRAGADLSDKQALHFRREFHTLAGLVHPNIVQVFDYGVAREGLFYTMELLEGQDLRAMGRCPIPTACALLRDVAAALALLHAKNLVHRDVGPRNVRCTSGGIAKLLDFGVMATWGVTGDVAGTPPCMPPETVRLLPIDHKADLFGLGALAYWLLCGRHAYPAKSILELPRLWAERPERPSDVRPEVPAALSDLVLSLLSLDPLGRPTRAAEVIDRLVAIGGLPTGEVEVQARQGYLLSASLVGRHGEISKIRELVEQAARGRGGAAVIEGPLGEGKSRLLRECSLEAQLAGLEVVYASSEAAGRGPYGLLRALVKTLLSRMSGEVFRAAAPHAPILARVLPEVVPEEARSTLVPAPLDGDPRQDRMRLQSALTSFLTNLTSAHSVASSNGQIERRGIAILVDDLHLADEGSAAVLAQLVHAAPERALLTVFTVGTDEPIHAQAAVASIGQAAERIRLRGLAAVDVEQLVAALFGDALHARVSSWIHEATLGSPMRVLELARSLVDRGIVKYEHGLWTIPEVLDKTALPPGLSDAMDRKVAGLHAATRALSEVLAVHGGDIPLSVCVALDESGNERATFAALDELASAEVLIGAEDRFRFRHEGVKNALLRGLSEGRRKSLHLRVAEFLTRAGEVSPEREAEVGWHFYQGGRALEAAPLLERAGRRMHDAQSFRDAVPPLEAALSVYEAHGGSPVVCLDLRRLLVIAGVVFERRVLLRYAETTFEELRRHGGMHIADRVARIFGKKVGLIIGVLAAKLVYRFTPAAKRGPEPVLALTTLGALVTVTASAYSLVFDLKGLRKHLRHIELFSAFPDRLPYVSYLFCQSLLAIPIGRWRVVVDNARRCLDLTAKNPPRDLFYRRNAIATAHYMLASAIATDQNPAFEKEVEEVKKQELRFFDVSAELVRLFYHRLRGEEDVAREIESRVELSFVQLGSMWIFESQLPWVSSFAYAITRDVLGLKRCIEKLDRLCKAGYAFEPFLDIARGEYFRERGQLDAAHAALTRALSALPDEELFRRQRALTALAEVLLAQGRAAEAQSLADQAVALSLGPDTVHLTWRMRCGLIGALAVAAQGDLKTGAERLDRLLRDVEPVASPTMTGSLSEARARVALLMGDRLGYETHLAQVDRCFRGTRNPALVARIERLVELGSPAAKRAAADMGDASMTRREGADDIALAMADCESQTERAAKVLELLLASTSGAEGHLYLFEKGRLVPIASDSTREPNAEWMALLLRAVLTNDEEGATVVAPPKGLGADAASWMPVILSMSDKSTHSTKSKRVVVGAAAIVQGAIPLEPPSESVVEALARELSRTDESPVVSVGSLGF